MKISRNIAAFLGWRPTGDLGAYTIYTSKRGAVVFYPRAPPNKPPSPGQTRSRNAFRAAAAAWATLPTEEKIKWQLAAHRAGLRITGYDLWVSLCRRPDPPTLSTVCAHSQINLTF